MKNDIDLVCLINFVYFFLKSLKNFKPIYTVARTFQIKIIMRVFIFLVLFSENIALERVISKIFIS